MKYEELPKWAKQEVHDIVLEWYNGDNIAAKEYMNKIEYELSHDDENNQIVTF